uniref:Uncharacterized protein n=1 Tax=Helicobacter pylori TaxID=210 RepID=Q8KKC5_HELPX|nr:hypothetical protein [Helicobacter pylori]AAM22672.1 unknown [Helicobacter pylori]
MTMSNNMFTNRRNTTTLDERIKAVETAEGVKLTNDGVNDQNDGSDGIGNLKEVNEFIDAERKKNVEKQNSKQDLNARLGKVRFSKKEIQQLHVHKERLKNELEKINENNGKNRYNKVDRARYSVKNFSLGTTLALIELVDSHVKNELVSYIFDYESRSKLINRAIINQIENDLQALNAIIEKIEKEKI